MQASSRTREFLVALFLLGAMLLAPPLLVIFNQTTRVLGIPTLYLYLFVVWAALIVLTALVVERGDTTNDLAEATTERAGKETSAEGPTDA